MLPTVPIIVFVLIIIFQFSSNVNCYESIPYQTRQTSRHRNERNSYNNRQIKRSQNTELKQLQLGRSKKLEDQTDKLTKDDFKRAIFNQNSHLGLVGRNKITKKVADNNQSSYYSRRKPPKPKTLSWLYLAYIDDCENSILTPQQKTICKNYPLLYPFIQKAAKDTVDTCVKIMSKRKWDCSQLQKELQAFEAALKKRKKEKLLKEQRTSSNRNRVNVVFYGTAIQFDNENTQNANDLSNLPKRSLPVILKRDTAEAAFVEALASSILTHHIASACADEDIPYCDCGDYKVGNQQSSKVEYKQLYKRDSELISVNKFAMSEELRLQMAKPNKFDSPIVEIDGYKINLKEIDPELLNSSQTCSDNIEFGSKITDTFINAAMDVKSSRKSEYITKRKRSHKRRTTITLELGKMSRATSPRQRILYHNTITGVNIIKNNILEKCECVGFNRSCMNQVCRKTVPSLFPQISDQILSMYDQAAYRVRYKNRKITATDEKLEEKINEKLKREIAADDLNSSNPSKQDMIDKLTQMEKSANRELVQNKIRAKQALIYRVRKLNFCEADDAHGILGTKRRECAIAPGTGEYHCTRLCCDRGFQTLTTASKKDCNCRYSWFPCCSVKCEVCETVETKHYCN